MICSIFQSVLDYINPTIPEHLLCVHIATLDNLAHKRKQLHSKSSPYLGWFLPFGVLLDGVRYQEGKETENDEEKHTLRRMTSPSSVLLRGIYCSSSNSARSPYAKSTGVLCVCHPVIVLGRPA